MVHPRGYDTSQQSLALQLLEAVEERSLQDIIKLLDQNNVDPNIVIPGRGISPFHLVIGCDCSYFAKEATRVFLQYNGNPNTRSEDGLTPVHIAAVWGRTELLVLLLLNGGDPWLRDSEYGYTPLHFALKEKHWETAFILQRYQLKDRRNCHSDVNITPRFNLNLNTVVVSAGEMQAEYSVLPQENVSSVLKSSVKESQKDIKDKKCNWNIEPLETDEYVRQWCHKEFPPLPVTSTPTHHKTLNTGGIIRQYHPPTVCTDNFRTESKSLNITCSKQMTPKKGDTSSNVEPTSICHSKNFFKGSTDVRKNLFLELKRRFSGLKLSSEVSKNDTSKKNIFERSSGYFGRKSFLKLPKSEKMRNSAGEKSQDQSAAVSTNDDSCSTGNLSFRTSRSVESDKINTSFHISNCEYSLENSPIDEVDALPLIGTVDTSVEWIASQSCFSEEASPNSSYSQSYFTCDEGPAIDGNRMSLLAQDEASVTPISGPVKADTSTKVPLRPPRRKELKIASHATAFGEPLSSQSTASFGTIISEKFSYTDEEARIVLIEDHLLTSPVDMPSPSDSESVVSVPQTIISDAHTVASDLSSVPASFSYDAVALRKELLSLGEVVGPITSTTQKVYLRHLYRLKKKNYAASPAVLVPNYPSELECLLKSHHWEVDLMNFCEHERLMCAPFENPDPKRRWREGVTKSSFNYLLLDPRLSRNMPANVKVHDLSTWHQFISAIFYIGKGKRSRPYAHLYQAVHVWNKGNKLTNDSAKIRRILDIWTEGHGVVCLHIFHNIIPVEAFTREASMIDAIGINNLVNVKSGEYYGPASTWRLRQKRQLGIYLLYQAMRIFLCEGERQLRPGDID